MFDDAHVLIGWTEVKKFWYAYTRGILCPTLLVITICFKLKFCEKIKAHFHASWFKLFLESLSDKFDRLAISVWLILSFEEWCYFWYNKVSIKCVIISTSISVSVKQDGRDAYCIWHLFLNIHIIEIYRLK